MSRFFNSNTKPQQSANGLPDLFVPSAREKEFVQSLQDEVKAVIIAQYPDMEAFIGAVEAAGYPVLCGGPEFQIKLSLLLVGAEPGFIAPTLPKYEELVASLKKMFPNKAHLDFSKGFLLTIKDLHHFSFLVYQFYHAMAYSRKLEGYSHTARHLYALYSKKYQGKLHPKLLEKLGYEETYQLKMGIRRDKEALQFLRYVVHEVFIPVNNGKLLESGKAQA